MSRQYFDNPSRTLRELQKTPMRRTNSPLTHVEPVGQWSWRRLPRILFADESKTGRLPTSRSRYWVSLFLALFAALVALSGLWEHPEGFGREDWDQILAQGEACALTIREYGQFPWWNPWNCGGMPLASHPLCSPRFLLNAWFGTEEMARISLALHLLIAVAGAHRLAWEIRPSVMGSAAAGMLGALSPSVACYVAVGHFPIETIAYLPWSLHFLRRSRDHGAWGFALGTTLGLAAFEYLHYVTIITFILAAVLGAGWWLTGSNTARRHLSYACVAAVCMLFGIAGCRLVMVGQLARENPHSRENIESARIGWPPWSIFVLYIAPGMSLDPIDPITKSEIRGMHEVIAYAGIIPVVLFGISLRFGWRWWHSVFLACAWLGMGNNAWYHPSLWLQPFPPFSILRVATRWRLPAMLAMSLGINVVLGRWESSRWRPVAWLLAGLIVMDLVLHSRNILGQTFVAVRRSPLARPVVGVIEQYVDPVWMNGVAQSWGTNTGTHRFTASGLGILGGWDPILPRRDDAKGPRGIGDPDYQGEFGPRPMVRQTYWSPNKIVLEGPPGTRAWINQNVSSYWRVNGERPFADARVVDRSRRMEGEIPASGSIEFSIQPPLAFWGWSLQLASLTLALAWWSLRGKRLPRPPGEPS